jgi:dTDP-4-amino-4,6-dideoxygalactose transaminase
MKTQIPFCRADIDRSEIEAVEEVLHSGWLTTGKKCRQFEEEIKNYLGCNYAIPVNSCTAALHLSLLTAGIGPGDEVITTPNTFVATVNTILHVGAHPILVDIDYDTGNISPTCIQKKITKKTKAIVPVHYSGLACEMEPINQLAKVHDIKVIEDSAHALGTKIGNQMVGHNSEFACFSFYPTKTITTIEGGLVATNNEEFANTIKLLSLHGLSKNAWSRYNEIGNWRYDVTAPGFKYNMTDVQAAVGLCQLKKVDSFIQKRRALAEVYRKNLCNLKTIDLMKDDKGHSYHLFVIRLNECSKINRDQLIFELGKLNIGTSVNFVPVYHFTYFKEHFKWSPAEFSNCERHFSGLLSLPLYPSLTIDQVNEVCHALIELVGQ